MQRRNSDAPPVPEPTAPDASADGASSPPAQETAAAWPWWKRLLLADPEEVQAWRRAFNIYDDGRPWWKQALTGVLKALVAVVACVVFAVMTVIIARAAFGPVSPRVLDHILAPIFINIGIVLMALGPVVRKRHERLGILMYHFGYGFIFAGTGLMVQAR